VLQKVSMGQSVVAVQLSPPPAPLPGTMQMPALQTSPAEGSQSRSVTQVWMPPSTQAPAEQTSPTRQSVSAAQVVPVGSMGREHPTAAVSVRTTRATPESTRTMCHLSMSVGGDRHLPDS
jgi:hypothetical protein